jgi:hypothetical protein
MGNYGRSSHLTPPVNASDARSFRAGALPSMIQFTLGILRWNQEEPIRDGFRVLKTAFSVPAEINEVDSLTKRKQLSAIYSSTTNSRY